MGHLGAEIPHLQRVICYRTVHDIGAVVEKPLGSNRGTRVDEYNTRSGAPLGSYWCASWATAIWEDAGAAVPPKERASCDAIVKWARKEALWKEKSTTPEPGWMVLYTNGNTLADGPYKGQLDAIHVGIIVAVDPLVLTMEGNASLNFDRNGQAVVMRVMDKGKVYGYVVPRKKENT